MTLDGIKAEMQSLENNTFRKLSDVVTCKHTVDLLSGEIVALGFEVVTTSHDTIRRFLNGFYNTRWKVQVLGTQTPSHILLTAHITICLRRYMSYELPSGRNFVIDFAIGQEGAVNAAVRLRAHEHFITD